MKKVKILHIMISALVGLSLVSIMAVAPASAENAQNSGDGHLNITGNYSILWQEPLEADEAGGAAGAYAVPDMDGDGKPDVLVHTTKYYSSTNTRTAKVIAKRGTDGNHLWEESVSATGDFSCDILPLSAGDLDGDGLGDVIVCQHERDTATFVTTWKVIAKKGKDGTHLWEESISGIASYMWAAPVGDLDGDGLYDVVVFHWELDVAAGTTTATAIAKKGKVGTHLWEESVSAPQCAIQPIAALDLDGDGLNDIIVKQWEYNPATDIRTAKVIAKKGNNGTHLWEESVSASGGLSCEMWAVGATDLDGDGLNDVTVWQYKYDAPTDIGTAKVIAKKGKVWTHLWEESVSATGKCNCYMSAVCAGNLDGDGLGDVIVLQWKYDESTNIRTAKVIAKKGNNGHHLWEESVSATGKQYNCSIAASFCAGDLDGDGLVDVAVNQWKYDSSTDRTTAKVIAKKGNNGTHLWEESKTTSGERTCNMAVFWAGDLDSDGFSDVIVRQRECTPYPDMVTTTATAIAKKGKDGTHFWEAQSDEWIWVGAGRHDLNGDGRDDALIGTSSEMYAITYLSTGPEGDILVYYRGLGLNPHVVETTDLLRAIRDWADGTIPPGFSQAITTFQLLELIGEWAGE